MSKNVSTVSATHARRCPNCGTRVAQSAETCYFCGHDLSDALPGRRRITWIDLALVLALLLVAIFWWQMGSQPAELDIAVAGQTERPIATAAPAEPPPETTAAASVPDGAGAESSSSFQVTHLVQRGETLLAIAGRYGVTVEEIQLANGLAGELIRAGDELVIPVPAAAAEAAAPDGAGDDPLVPSLFRYVVRPGDNVVSIAVRFGATVEAILQANGLGPGDFIRPDQVLQIPVDQLPASVLASSEMARDLPPAAQSGPLYEAPRLLGPDDEQTVERAEGPLFRWISVDFLQPNEWYVLRVWPTEGVHDMPPPVWTKATSFRLETRWAPPSGQAVAYSWQVSVARIVPDQGEGREIQAASAPSEVRKFAWQ